MAKKFDITVELRVHIARKYETQKKAAEAWNVTQSLVSMVLKGKRAPTEAMLLDAGFTKVSAMDSYKKVGK